MNEQADGQKLQELLKIEKLNKTEEGLIKDHIGGLYITPEGRDKLVAITKPEPKKNLKKYLCETILSLTGKKWQSEIPDEELVAYIEILEGVVAGQPTNSSMKWRAIQLIYAKRPRLALELLQSTLESISPKTEVTQKYETYAKSYMGLDCGLELLQGMQAKGFNPDWMIKLVRQVKAWSDEKKAIVEKNSNRPVQAPKSDSLSLQQTQSVNHPTPEAPDNLPCQPLQSNNRPIPPINDVTVKPDSVTELQNFVTFLESGIADFKKVIQENKDLNKDLINERRNNQELIKEKAKLRLELDQLKEHLDEKTLLLQEVRNEKQTIEVELGKIKSRAEQDVRIAIQDRDNAVKSFKFKLWGLLKECFQASILKPDIDVEKLEPDARMYAKRLRQVYKELQRQEVVVIQDEKGQE